MIKSKSNNDLDELCYNLYVKNDRKISIINEYCIYLDMTLEMFFKHVINCINNNAIIPEYTRIFNHLATIRSNDKVIEYLDTISTSYKILRNNLMDYFINFRPDIYYTDEITKKRICENLSFYETHMAKLNKPINCKYPEISDLTTKLVMDFIESDYSILRFCYNENLNKIRFDRNVNNLKKTNPELYLKYIENVRLKEIIKSDTIENDVRKIFNNLKENPNYSIIDFLLSTNYDVTEIVNVADQILFGDDIKLFRKYIKAFKFINKLNDNQINELINSHFVLNINGELITVTSDDIIVITNFLKENNIPVSNETFNDGCIKYFNNKLIKGCSK